MHAKPPACAVVDLFNVDCIVKVARVVRIDRDNEFVPQIFAAIDHLLLDGFRNPIRFVENAFRELGRQIVFPNDRQHVDARRVGGSEHFNDVALRIDVA